MIGAAAILGGTGLAFLTGGAILPLFITGAAGFGLFEAGNAVYKMSNAKNSNDSNNASLNLLEAVAGIGLALICAKPALNKIGLLEKNTNVFKALFQCIGESPNSIGKSSRILSKSKALFSLEGIKGIKSVKGIDLALDGTDKTVDGFFKITNIRNEKIKGSIKINGEKVKLPDLDDPIDCCKWWKKHIGKKPLSVDDRKRAKILADLPKQVRARIVANVSEKGMKLTKYDNKELIRYRLNLNKRRVAIQSRDAVATRTGDAVVNKVTDRIYRDYVCQGIKNEKKLFVMIGQKAAGKSTLVDMMRKNHGVLVADSDEIRSIIGSQETELHGRLKYAVKDELANRAIAEGANFLAQFHGTGTGKATEVIRKFKKAGYDVEVMNLQVPEKELISRIFKRKAKTNKDADPLAVILCGKKEQKENFYSIVKKGLVKKAKCYDNNVTFGKPPKEIMDGHLKNCVLRFARQTNS